MGKYIEEQFCYVIKKEVALELSQEIYIVSIVALTCALPSVWLFIKVNKKSPGYLTRQ